MCRTKSAGGTASSTPVSPPITKVGMKPITQIIGVSKRILPRYMVNSQLNTLAPVGIEMIIVMPKKALTLAPDPIVKKWWSQVSQDTRAMTAGVDHRCVAEQTLAAEGRYDLRIDAEGGQDENVDLDGPRSR